MIAVVNVLRWQRSNTEPWVLGSTTPVCFTGRIFYVKSDSVLIKNRGFEAKGLPFVVVVDIWIFYFFLVFVLFLFF